MRTLVFQVDIGDGLHKPTDGIMKAVNERFKPSVERWAEKYGYDYKCYTDYVAQTHFAEEKRDLQTQRYWFLNQDYDRYVYLDLDIEVMEDAPPAPEVKGFGCATDWVQRVIDSFNRAQGYPKDQEYSQAGFMVWDREGADLFYRWFYHTLKEGRQFRGKQCDQTLINVFFNEYHDQRVTLDPRWNRPPDTVENPYCVHYAGKHIKRLFE